MTTTYTADYETEAMKTAPRAEDISISPMQKRMLLMALGLCGEAGEIAEMIKKHIFHGHPMTAEKVIHLQKELGDVQWYIAYGAQKVAASNLNGIMHANIEKLRARYPDGQFDTEKSQHRKEGDI